ncbi:hypothetical protein BGHDH14_bgh06030 [Blumeria hordei DH14]|uniref:Uncharacterized protein n=1 Tax=Blumeria graminis f. sp. hordei (strain DH14) TaxID=546991 RepID=N1JQH5_BLUG1|nr:hypothetical protein BGHDH14_bgh06030 [Blumeria hordei DH14]
MSKSRAIALMREIPAVVVSAGLMQKTVKVQVGVQQWNSHIKKISLVKYFNRRRNHLVHDPNDSVRIGDIVAISAGSRVAKHVRHVVTKIIAPFGVPIEERPPIPTIEERNAAKEEKRRLKQERSEKKLSNKLL